jgi:methionyl-tRNA formyltransferase
MSQIRTIYIYPGAPDNFELACGLVADEFGFRLAAAPSEADVAIAPLLTRKLRKSERDAPLYGTLIFHPSILPYHRGPDAIKWAYRLKERVTGVTWFWAAAGYDTGDICEQEPVLLNLNERPGVAYKARFLPAGIRALRRALQGVAAGKPRRIAQIEADSTYEPAVRRATLAWAYGEEAQRAGKA